MGLLGERPQDHGLMGWYFQVASVEVWGSRPFFAHSCQLSQQAVTDPCGIGWSDSKGSLGAFADLAESMQNASRGTTSTSVSLRLGESVAYCFTGSDRGRV